MVCVRERKLFYTSNSNLGSRRNCGCSFFLLRETESNCAIKMLVVGIMKSVMVRERENYFTPVVVVMLVVGATEIIFFFRERQGVIVVECW